MKAATWQKECLQEVNKFQSTPPVKAATGMSRDDILAARISIHAAREGGDFLLRRERLRRVISIHAAREGGDQFGMELCCHSVISIHAAREGGDVNSGFFVCVACNFNPRRP